VNDQLAQLPIRHRGLTDLAVEVDVSKDPVETRVGLFQRGERLIQPISHVVVQLIADVVPPSYRWDEERVGVNHGLVECTGDPLLQAGAVVRANYGPLERVYSPSFVPSLVKAGQRPHGLQQLRPTWNSKQSWFQQTQ